MRRNEPQDIELSKFIDKIKKRSEEAMNGIQTAEELQKAIGDMCLNCYLPKNSECEICNGHSKDQLFLNFDGLK